MNTRRTRPEPEREAPKRKWTQQKRTDQATAEASKATDPRESAYEAVNNAYSVIDDYMRQGQRMAERFWMPMAQAGQESPDFMAAPERFIRAMGDMTMAWMEVMQQWGQSNPSSKPAAGSAGPFTAGAATSAPAPASPAPRSTEVSGIEQAMTVRVTAAGRVETSVHLRSQQAMTELVASDLRAFSGDAPAITGVKLVTLDGEPPEVHIDVPEGQPATAYYGIIVDRRTQRPQGTISLTVL